jgi:leader peptidase (prepilin peptidase)/N-methyltransferase
LVEGLSALFAVLILLRFGLTVAAPIYYLFLAALIVITFVDLDHRIIPNAITYPGIPLGILASLLLPARDFMDALVGAALGGGVLLAVALLFEWIRKKEGMGFGDVKLLAMIGAFLGWKAVLLTLVVSSFMGVFVGYTALRLSGKGRDHPIPYGPFLALGAAVYLLGGDAWVEWYLYGMK